MGIGVMVVEAALLILILIFFGPDNALRLRWLLKNIEVQKLHPRVVRVLS